MTVNQCNFVGNLGKDPELKQISDDFTVCNFSIAVTGGKIKGEPITEWVNVKTFNKVAENCGKYLSKGSKVFVSGMMQTEKYQKDGQDRYITKIAANTVQFLDPAKRQEDQHHQGGVDFGKMPRQSTVENIPF